MQAGNRVEPTAEVAIAAGLDQLHRRVEVHAQRIGADAIDQRSHLSRRQIARLDQANIAQQEGRQERHRARQRCASFQPHQHRSLRAQAEAQPQLFGDAGEVTVDLLRLIRAASHRTDDDRRRQYLAQERRAQIDVVEVAVGQRASWISCRSSNSVPLLRNSTSPDAQRLM